MGGTFNGGTSNDGTVYYETVPRDALEKVLWMESDRMGYFINTVTEGGLKREIDVVSNENDRAKTLRTDWLSTWCSKTCSPKDIRTVGR